MNPEQILEKHVVIVGGGIAGLAAAYRLQELGAKSGLPLRYSLLESGLTLGGKIQTDRQDGLVVEGGPDSFLLQKPWAAQLAQSLGLENELIGTNPDQKKLFVVNKGRLTPMPEGVMLVIPTRFMPFVTSPLISWPGKLRMGLDLFIPRRTDDGDESIASFIRRRLGEEALQKIAEPLMSGIHVSDPEQQSLLGTFPRFRSLEKQHGSLIRGMLAQRRAGQSNGNAASPAGRGSWKSSAFVSLRGGMGALVEALQAALTGGQILTGCAVTNLERDLQAGYRVHTASGRTLQADAVLLATPAFSAAALLEPLAPQLAQELTAIRYVSTATVSLAFRRSEVGNPLNGVGFIIPRGEQRRITACTVSSTKFAGRAPQDLVLLRCFVGGPGQEQALDQSDTRIIQAVSAELAALMGIQAEPVFARVYRWEKGNAQYDVGHLERVKYIHELASQIPGLFLTGSAYEGIGVPDCIHQGQQAAEKVAAYARQTQPSLQPVAA